MLKDDEEMLRKLHAILLDVSVVGERFESITLVEEGRGVTRVMAEDGRCGV